MVAAIGEVAGRYGASRAQVALAWLVQRADRLGVTCVPIPGSRRVQRMRENLAFADLRLDDDAMAELDAVAAAVEGGRNINLDPTWISSGRE
ncbi:hypothetical protein GCM10022199_21980 [Marihabitans asiaticum]